MTIRALSYGAGVQSTALLVLAAKREIDFPLALFANVGDDTENAESLRLMRTVYGPWAERHGVAVREIQRLRRDGTPHPSIRQWVLNDQRSVRIPMRMPNGAPGRRTCTDEYKRKPIARWLKEAGATANDPATIALGISVDEWHRMRSDSGFASIINAYPLIDLSLTRNDCRAIIADAGLPIPPKSSCTFCPFHDRGYWEMQARTHPDVFAADCAFEDRINAQRAAIGRDPVYIHPSARPLREAINTNQTMLFDTFAACDIAGYCGA